MGPPNNLMSSILHLELGFSIIFLYRSLYLNWYVCVHVCACVLILIFYFLKASQTANFVLLAMRIVNSFFSRLLKLFLLLLGLLQVLFNNKILLLSSESMRSFIMF